MRHGRKKTGCVSCGGSVGAEAIPWIEMIGYARPTSQRGDSSGSSLVLRVETGRAMCQDCALSRMHGVDPAQEGLGV